jgi:ABC-type sugar transport system permease subunit
MTRHKTLIRFLAVLVAVIVALGLRLWAVDRLPIDYDEDDYLSAGQYYARAIQRSDLAAVINYNYNYEHPPLTKLVYAATMLSLPDAPDIPQVSSDEPLAESLPEPHFIFARLSSALFGTLQVLALAIFNPLAGLLLAVHTWQIKYTSQIMLEPLPSLMSTLAVLFYVRARKRLTSQAWSSWLILSAVALGITAASKYTYAIAGVAVALDWLWLKRPKERRLADLIQWLAPVISWGIIAMAVFFAFDPYLWADPFNRLKSSLLFHGGYAQSQHVQEANLPMWQPLVWLFYPIQYPPGAFLVVLDMYIALLAAFGLRRLWHKQPVFVLWLGIAVGFLLVWPTKWPQYILMFTLPLAVAAAEGIQERLWEPFIRWIRLPREARRPPRDPAEARLGRRDLRRALPWLLPGLLALAVLALYPFLFQAAMTLTDFTTFAIRDGIHGGVWRAVWQGLTGQVKPVDLQIFTNAGSKQVNFAGFRLLEALFSGAAGDLMFFNVMWMALSVGLQALLGIGLALLLSWRGIRLGRWWQVLLILPWTIPEFVGALVWYRLVEPRFGWLILAAHLPKDLNLLAGTGSALLILLMAATWYGFPFIMLATLAGLKMISPEVYDAAAIDGASGWQRFRYVTWPLLLPLVAPALIIRGIFAFNQFYLFYGLRTDYPLTTLATFSYYVFDPTGYYGGQFALSAGLNIFTVAVLVALILWFNRWTRAAEGVTYA